MSNTFFADNSAVDLTELPVTRKMECKICWQVYDPAQGDEVWQIPPGTPFTQLPSHWSCPQCGAAKQDFLVIDD